MQFCIIRAGVPWKEKWVKIWLIVEFGNRKTLIYFALPSSVSLSKSLLFSLGSGSVKCFSLG